MLVGKGSLSVELNLWNPLYALAPFALLVVSIPLAIFAVITTSIAISLLFFRAAVVYVQLAVAIASAWIDPPTSKPPPALRHYPSSSSPERTSPNRQRISRSSNASSTSSQETIVPAAKQVRLPNTNGSRTMFLGTSEITRDFESVGGWRAPGDEDEEALWMGINSRLQLPADATTRRHHRSLTAGASPDQRWSRSPEMMRMSPVQSRARTPLRSTAGDTGDYFPPQPITSSRRMSVASEPSKGHKRRKSGSGSTSSIASTITMATKEAGE